MRTKQKTCNTRKQFVFEDHDELNASRENRAERKLALLLNRARKNRAMTIAIIILFIVLFLIRSYYVPSTSMMPTLHIGDRIMSVAMYFPSGSTYSRGDIVCFRAPSNEVYVKRVIGVGGDRITISGDDVYVNGELSPWQGTGGVRGSMDVILGQDEYWVMGDNRSNSEDSRYIGAIPADRMISKVIAIYFPFDRVQLL